MKACLALCLLLVVSAVISPISAQSPIKPPPPVLDTTAKDQVIDALLRKLNEAYVFAETAKKMDSDIRARVAKKEYDAITDGRQFAKKLTEDLQNISKDRHLGIRYSRESIPEKTGGDQLTPQENEMRRQFSVHMNHGFSKVERMEGNIGYVDLRGFTDPEMGAETAAAAMAFVANTDALIVDLRQNSGGEPAMVALACSYFFGDKPVHLNNLYWREGDRTEEFWTKADLPGRRYAGKDVYVLTSKQTFSGAEEFAYDLQALKRAVIVGETTGGGAHEGREQRLSEHFSAYIPAARAINPVTQTNWEGVGVKPDIEVPQDQALRTAYVAALSKAANEAAAPNLKGHLKQLLDQQQRELDALRKGAKGNQAP